LEDDVDIGEFVVIESGVAIGSGTQIDHHSVVKEGTRIGRSCRIGTHSVVGTPGFGFERDNDGRAYRMPHLGGVSIGDEVEIGNGVSIASGTIDPTRIESGVKIDDRVFIAHNVTVGRDAFIIASASVCGSTSIGARAWIAPAAALINKISIGADAVVGLGAVVVRDVPAGVLVVGNPARERGK
jgi:UDP-3-O-[3-hydroxymyristoyl] glucosamine N-acyltransferase